MDWIASAQTVGCSKVLVYTSVYVLQCLGRLNYISNANMQGTEREVTMVSKTWKCQFWFLIKKKCTCMMYLQTKLPMGSFYLRLWDTQLIFEISNSNQICIVV